MVNLKSLSSSCRESEKIDLKFRINENNAPRKSVLLYKEERLLIHFDVIGKSIGFSARVACLLISQDM
ncbi:hypothetical protein D917_01759 [Trichinella nativa]|uniref:Uncharacterized protein n=1 Tax=Trichinella nativa TaxID=6335 RepID=A0A1Y3EQ13_9BILA|nr:hypothetical protein D917_01759 [Trichinella nativa]